MQSPHESAASSLLDLVERFSVADLAAELGRIRQQMARLETEERLLGLAIDIAKMRGAGQGEDEQPWGFVSPGAGGAGLVEPNASADGPDTSAEKPTPKGSPSRQLVRAILAERPDRLWTPKDVHEELRRRGYNSKLASTRVMLQRLYGSEDVERPETGKYKASASAAAQLSAPSEEDQT